MRKVTRSRDEVEVLDASEKFVESEDAASEKEDAAAGVRVKDNTESADTIVEQGFVLENAEGTYD